MGRRSERHSAATESGHKGVGDLNNIFVGQLMVLTHALRLVLHATSPNKRMFKIVEQGFVELRTKSGYRPVAPCDNHRILIIW